MGRRPTRQPRVAVVCQPTTSLVPPTDSVTLVSTELARRLSDRASMVLVGSGGHRRVAPGWVEGLEAVLVPTGPDRVLERAVGRAEAVGAHRRLPSFARATHYLPYAARAGLAVRRAAVDVVHVQSFSQFVPVIRRLHPGARIVLHMHCEWLSQLDREVVGGRLEQADLVVGCSEHIVAAVRQRFPPLADRCLTVHNGVTPAARPRAGSRPPARPGHRLLFVSRVSPEKGLHVLLDAMGPILERHPDVTLDIAGTEHSIPPEYIVDLDPDPLVRALRRFYGGTAYADELRRRLPPATAGRVRFLGFVPPGHLSRLYRQSDVLVHPSLVEAFGLPPAEAMAAGIPVVASRVGGIPEIVEDGVSGLLVPPGDPRALAGAVGRLLDDDALSARLAAAGRRRVERHFGWDRAADTLWAAYERLLAPPRG